MKLHHVKWMEGHDLELEKGIIVTLKVKRIRNKLSGAVYYRYSESEHFII